MKYIQYIEMDTENKLLKTFYGCLMKNQDLMDICSLLRMKEQLSKFIDTNFKPLNSTIKGFAPFGKNTRRVV